MGRRCHGDADRLARIDDGAAGRRGDLKGGGLLSGGRSSRGAQARDPRSCCQPDTGKTMIVSSHPNHLLRNAQVVVGSPRLFMPKSRVFSASVHPKGGAGISTMLKPVGESTNPARRVLTGNRKSGRGTTVPPQSSEWPPRLQKSAESWRRATGPDAA